MNPIDLDLLERLEAAATPGPWDNGAGPDGNLLWFTDRRDLDPATEESRANLALVMALRNAFPSLLAELRARRRQEFALIGLFNGVKWEDAGPLSRFRPEGEKYIGHDSMCAILAALERAAPAKGGEGET